MAALIMKRGLPVKVKTRFLVCSLLALLVSGVSYAGDAAVQQDEKALPGLYT